MKKDSLKVRVVLYSKPGCHLCEEMKVELARADCPELFTLAEINIESQPDLYQRYQYDIPVLEIDGLEVFRHRVNAEEFHAYMLTLARPARSEPPA